MRGLPGGARLRGLSVLLVLAAFLLFLVTISYTSGPVPEGCEEVFAAASGGGDPRHVAQVSLARVKRAMSVIPS